MRPPCFLVAGFLSVAPIAGAATIQFNSASEYDSNFREYTFSADTNWNAGGYLSKTTGDSATVAFYNTTATGGSGGSGGTGVGTNNNNVFGDVSLAMDFRTSGTLGVNGNSIGFFSRINSAGTSGYVAVFRMTSTTSADLRVWDSNTNPSTNALGDLLATQTLTSLPAGTFSTDTFYTFRLDITNVGGNVQFSGSIFTQAGALIGNFGQITDTSSPVTAAGQVGLRMGSNSGSGTENRFDNFTVEAIPEPSSALFGVAGFLGLLIRRRR